MKKGQYLVLFPMVKLATMKKGQFLVLFPMVKLASNEKGTISCPFPHGEIGVGGKRDNFLSAGTN